MDLVTGPKIVAFPEEHVGIEVAFLRGLPTEVTRRIYRQVLRAFGQHLGRDLVTATRRDIEAYRASMEALGRTGPTIAKHLAAVSGFFDFALAEGAIDRSPAATVRRPRLPDGSPRRALSQADVRAILSKPDTSTLVGLRDRALLTVLAVQGWRASEALGLRVEDLTEEQGHHVAEVRGKGGKVVRVTLADATLQAVTNWTQAASITSGPIFVAVLKGGRVQIGAAISPQCAWKRVRQIAKSAGIARPVHPHLFRHSAVTAALQAGVPLHEVQDFARHADPRTTRRYDSHRLSLNNRSPHVIAALVCPTVEAQGQAGNPQTTPVSEPENGSQSPVSTTATG